MATVLSCGKISSYPCAQLLSSVHTDSRIFVMTYWHDIQYSLHVGTEQSHYIYLVSREMKLRTECMMYDHAHGCAPTTNVMAQQARQATYRMLQHASTVNLLPQFRYRGIVLPWLQLEKLNLQEVQKQMVKVMQPYGLLLGKYFTKCKDIEATFLLQEKQ